MCEYVSLHSGYICVSCISKSANPTWLWLQSQHQASQHWLTEHVQCWLTRKTFACLVQPEQMQLHSSSVRAHTERLQELLCRSCQRCCCRESLSLAGSSFSCLFMLNSWELENPVDRPRWIYQTASDCSVAAFLSKAALQRRMNT